jgi:hypothetical protein
MDSNAEWATVQGEVRGERLSRLVHTLKYLMLHNKVSVIVVIIVHACKDLSLFVLSFEDKHE